MSPETVVELFKRLAELNPKPTTELYYTNSYTLMVAVVLSAQATDVGVNKATKHLFAVADNPEKMVRLGEEKLREYIKSIGLFNTKAKNISKLSQQLLDLHGGQVPENREALEALPGVGRKTANVILNTAFGQPTIAVDTHIFRVSNRTGLSNGKTPLAVEKDLLKIIPKDRIHDAHHWLVLHGRYICVARKPKCAICPIYDQCGYQFKTA